MADYITKQFFGTAQTIINSATDIAAGNFGAAGTDFDNTTDSTLPYATHCVAMLEAPDWAAAPVFGTVLELWGVMIDVDGTDDDSDAPSGTAQNGARFLCAWTIDDVDALQRRTTTFSLEGIRKFTPYIRNSTATNLNNDAGTSLVVKLTPFSYGVTA
jgi:hypothetical protein